MWKKNISRNFPEFWNTKGRILFENNSVFKGISKFSQIFENPENPKHRTNTQTLKNNTNNAVSCRGTSTSLKTLFVQHNFKTGFCKLAKQQSFLKSITVWKRFWNYGKSWNSEKKNLKTYTFLKKKIVLPAAAGAQHLKKHPVCAN